MITIEDFINKHCIPPIPENPKRKVKLLAKELALGIHFDLWERHISTSSHFGGTVPTQNNQYKYFEKRWHSVDVRQFLLLLESYGFTNQKPELTQKAFELIDEVSPSTIFISYKRSESSAFALLVLARLKKYNLEPFIDMALRAGDDWHPALEANIKSRDYFIVLVGNETLKSTVTVKEIQWAIQYSKIIIPIWHNGFEFDQDVWHDIPSEIANAIGRKHAIKVFEESALGYNTAIVELLNRFEITP